MKTAEIKRYILDDDRPLLCLLIINAILISFPFIRELISFYTMCVITVYSIILLIYRLFSGNLRIRPRAITWLFLIFSAVLLISLAVKRDSVSAIMTNTVMIIINLMVFASPMTIQDEETRASHFLFIQRVTLYSGTIIICAVLFLNFIMNKNIHVTAEGITLIPFVTPPRYEGIMGFNYIGFLSFIDMAFCFSVFFKKDTKSAEKVLMPFFFIINAVPLVISGCRSSQIALLVFLMFFIMLIVYRKMKRKALFFIVLAIVIVCFCMLVVKVTLTRGYNPDSVSTYDFINSISAGRLPIYKLALVNGSSTLFGGGTQPVVDYFGWLCHMHNILLDIYCFYGIFAVLSFSAAIIVIIVSSLKFLCTAKGNGSYVYQGIVAFSVMIAVLAQNMTDCFIFSQPYSVSNIIFHAVLGYVLYFITKGERISADK